LKDFCPNTLEHLYLGYSDHSEPKLDEIVCRFEHLQKLLVDCRDEISYAQPLLNASAETLRAVHIHTTKKISNPLLFLPKMVEECSIQYVGVREDQVLQAVTSCPHLKRVCFVV